MSRQVVIAALIVGSLVFAVPAAAQRQRNPGGAGEGGDRGSRGARTDPGRGTEQPRPYAAPPPSASRSGEARGVDRSRYAIPRGQADRGDDGRRHGNPGVAGRVPVAPRGSLVPNPDPRGYGPRGYVDRGYVNRGYAGRYVDPGYRVRPGYGVPRAYAVPRGYVGPRVYDNRAFYGRPRYIAPGWRGPWGGYAVVPPRFISPYVLGYRAWQPYYYRPSIGLGLYYGADGLYPFGAVPQTYYDPLPGVPYGGLRITDAPRDAQVFADGNYVGIVDDFDGAFQHLNLEPGEHRVEIHAPGLTPIAFDVMVQPGRTITLRADLP